MTVIDPRLDHNPSQIVETADEVAHGVGEGALAVGDPDAANESFLSCKSLLE